LYHITEQIESDVEDHDHSRREEETIIEIIIEEIHVERIYHVGNENLLLSSMHPPQCLIE
jgi:hypothetical protein